MVERSCLNAPFCLFNIAYGISTGWREAPQAMLDLIKGVFSGLIQSRIIEKANKVLRECETRESNSKVGLGRIAISRCSVWWGLSQYA